MNSASLDRLEFPRVTAWIAERAASSRARARLAAWPPSWDAAWRRAENARLVEAIRRSEAPGEWCRVPEGEVVERLDPRAPERLDGPGLRVVLEWLDAGRETREAWSGEDDRARHPALAALADRLPPLEALREAIGRAIEPDGRVSDAASPKLARSRRDLGSGERDLERDLERWARGFGENAYVTRHGDRFVALVPAAGFPRRRGVVHDVSGSGQSLFVEPLEACESNNHLIELRAAITEEERRILGELADAVRRETGAIERLEETLAHLDTLRARARWAREVGGTAIEPGGDRLGLRDARHPLLLRALPPEAIVPLDLELGNTRRLLLVSGPNMGGKTILLKTVGLAAALAHAALPVPAREGSAVPELGAIEADLGDHQSVDAGLSTFAAHLASLRAMAEGAGPGTLVLADELGAGTDPDEGAALGRALLEHFARHRCWGVLTTHYGSLKRAATEIEGLVNGSLEFDEATLTSRFRFLPDVPGASHALAVAERLGFPSAVLARARALTPESALAVERLLGELQAARRALDEQKERLRAATAEAEAAAASHREAADEARRSLARTRERLTRESDAILARARELWQTVQREARRAEKSRVSAETIRAQVEASERDLERLEREADAALAATGAQAPSAPVDSVTLGQRVRIADLGVEAEVASLPDAEGRLMLRRGAWSIQSHVSRLTAGESAAAAGQAARAANGPSAVWDTGSDAPGLDVDLRGQDVDEALTNLDHALDRAVVNGLGELRVIHGIGKGVLRVAVERHLRGHPQVASQRMGQVGEGGRGVTVVRLR